MKCVRPAPDGTWPHSIGSVLTGFGCFLFSGESILEINRAGAIAAQAKPNISNTLLYDATLSPTKLNRVPSVKI